MIDFTGPKQSGLASWMVKNGKKAMINPANGKLVINKNTGLTQQAKIKGMSTPTGGWFGGEFNARKVFEIDMGVKTPQAAQQGWYVISADTTQYMSKDGKTWVKGIIPGVVGYSYYIAGCINKTWYIFSQAALSSTLYYAKSNNFSSWINSNSHINNIPHESMFIAQNNNTICLAGRDSFSSPVYSTVSTFNSTGEVKRQRIGIEAINAVIAATAFPYTIQAVEPIAIAYNGKKFCVIVRAETTDNGFQSACRGYFTYTSTDGLNWSYNSTPIFPIVNIYSPFLAPISIASYLSAIEGLFCMLAFKNGSLCWYDSYTSADGKTWSGPYTVSDNDALRLNVANGMTASKDTFAIIGDATSNSPSGFQARCMYSKDGKTWAASSLFGDIVGDYSGGGIGSNGKGFVATTIGTGYGFYYSKTGANWERIGLDIGVPSNINSHFTRR